jgi:hypothetical protein
LIGGVSRQEIKMNVRNRPLYDRLLALSASAALLGISSAALAGPCRLQIVQLERQIAVDLPPKPVVFGSLSILPQSLDAQLHHQPTLDTVVQAQHFTYKDGNAQIDRAWKADSDGDVEGCSQAIVEARRLYDLRK